MLTYILQHDRFFVDEQSTEGGVKVTNTALLKKIINESGLKYDYIAEKIGISRQSLWMKINDNSEFKASEIQKLCSVLNIQRDKRDSIFFLSSVD